MAILDLDDNQSGLESVHIEAEQRRLEILDELSSAAQKIHELNTMTEAAFGEAQKPLQTNELSVKFSKIESLLYRSNYLIIEIYNALANIRMLIKKDRDSWRIRTKSAENTEKEKKLAKEINVYASKDVIIIQSPILARLGSSSDYIYPFIRYIDFSPVVESGFKLKDGETIEITTVCVYPSSAKPSHYIDADNINTKAVSDPLCNILDIDDNIMNVHHHFTGIVSDKVKKGCYTVVQKDQNSCIFDEERLIKILEKSAKTFVIFAKGRNVKTTNKKRKKSPVQ